MGRMTSHILFTGASQEMDGLLGVAGMIIDSYYRSCPKIPYV